MGGCKHFICGKCGFQSWLDLSQPGWHQLGFSWERYCPKKNKITAFSYDPGEVLEPANKEGKKLYRDKTGSGTVDLYFPERFVCQECKDESPECNSCDGTCTEELKIASQTDQGITAYFCPRHDCDGIMEPADTMECWD